VCYRAYCVAGRWTPSWEGAALGVGVFLLWMALEPGFWEGTLETGWPAALEAAPAFWAGAWIVLRIVGSVVFVPVAEELAFRGFLLRRLQSSDFEGVSPRRFTWL